jgi:hypothetical protein
VVLVEQLVRVVLPAQVAQQEPLVQLGTQEQQVIRALRVIQAPMV